MKHDDNFLNTLFSLEDRVAVVTGGLGRLGTEFVASLVEVGAKVAVLDIVDTPNDRLLGLSKTYSISFHKVDIRSEEEVQKTLEKIEKTWGVVSLLVNNAGWRASPNEATQASVPFEEYPMDVWDNVFGINITAAAMCAKHVGGRMIETNTEGVIINIASIYGIVSPDQRIYEQKATQDVRKKPFVKDASYGSSKAALIALTRDLATQWAQYGIRVVALAPGGVQEEHADPEFVKNYEYRTPLGRMAKADEFNGALLFLASEASSYMTGTCLIVDGGWTAW